MSKNNIPRLQVLLSRDNKSYALAGFEAVDAYYYANNVIWKAIKKIGTYRGFSELDILKLLATELVAQNEYLQKLIIDFSINNGCPPIIDSMDILKQTTQEKTQ